MLEKPALEDSKIITVLKNDYGLAIQKLTFLPLGADANAAVYRADTATAAAYFVKLRRGSFDETSVTVPHLLRDKGIREIIAPLTTHDGHLWANIDDFRLILYPFIEGHNGWEPDLSNTHWMALGRALSGVHTTALPVNLSRQIQRETYSPYWRELVNDFQQQAEATLYSDPVAIQLAAFLKDKQAQISDIVRLAGQLAAVLETQSLEFVLCHSDVHAGNVLVDYTDGLYIVDWDQPIFAPKERDLMFIGGGVGSYSRDQLDQQEMSFYQGYGQTQVNLIALAYYRFERIVQDIAAYCQQLLLSDEGGQDREVSFGYLTSQFEPNAVIDVAYRTLQQLPSELQTL